MRFLPQVMTLVLAGLVSFSASGQTFSSGSTGSDGAYSPTVSGVFDPVALGIAPSGDNVFNFTTINIPTGVTIRLGASKLRNAPVTWLATGNVTIAGTLDLTGMPGPALNTSSAATLYSTRVLPEPGAGRIHRGTWFARRGRPHKRELGPGAVSRARTSPPIFYAKEEMVHSSALGTAERTLSTRRPDELTAPTSWSLSTADQGVGAAGTMPQVATLGESVVRAGEQFE